MDLFNEIKSLLKKYPELIIEEDNNFISATPAHKEGFEVWFSEDKEEYTVGYSGWHQHFKKSDAEDALECFAFGLSNKCRLKVTSRGGKTYKWQMEAFENNEWVPYSTTSLFWAPFWRKADIAYFTNDVLTM